MLTSRANSRLIPRVNLAALRLEQLEQTESGFHQALDPVNPTAFTAEYCTIQPTSGQELSVLPEGLRDKTSYKIFTDTSLRTNKEGTTELADEISIYGEIFTVYSVKRWTNNIRNNYEVIVVQSDRFETPHNLLNTANAMYKLINYDLVDELTWNNLWVGV